MIACIVIIMTVWVTLFVTDRYGSCGYVCSYYRLKQQEVEEKEKLSLIGPHVEVYRWVTAASAASCKFDQVIYLYFSQRGASAQWVIWLSIQRREIRHSLTMTLLAVSKNLTRQQAPRNHRGYNSHNSWNDFACLVYHTSLQTRHHNTYVLLLIA